MKQILCVIDLTDSAVKVLEVAARIATAWKGHLIVLYPYRLIDNRDHHGDIPSLKRKLEIEAKEKFDELRKQLDSAGNLRYDFVCEIGFVSDRIVANIRNKDVDMIVIGQEQTQASTDLKSFNLQKLLADANLPFVIVPSPVKAEARV